MTLGFSILFFTASFGQNFCRSASLTQSRSNLRSFIRSLLSSILLQITCKNLPHRTKMQKKSTHWVLSGAQSRNRTSDTRIFSPLLYRLSYLGMVGLAGLEPATSRLSGVRSNRLSYRPLLQKLLNGRGGGTRTPGPMVPNHVRYQTALHLDWRRRRDLNPRTR